MMMRFPFRLRLRAVGLSFTSTAVFLMKVCHQGTTCFGEFTPSKNAAQERDSAGHWVLIYDFHGMPRSTEPGVVLAQGLYKSVLGGFAKTFIVSVAKSTFDLRRLPCGQT